MKTLSATPAPVWSKGQACVGPEEQQSAARGVWAESATAQQRAMAAAGGGGDLAMAQAWVWSAEVEDDAKELDNACCNRMFQVFHMFGKNITSVHVDIAKVDLDFEVLLVFHMHITSVLFGYYIFIESFIIFHTI